MFKLLKQYSENKGLTSDDPNLSAESEAPQSWLIAKLFPCNAAEHASAIQASSQMILTRHLPLRASALDGFRVSLQWSWGPKTVDLDLFGVLTATNY